MVLHKSNFDIPARFSFQPYSAKWRNATAETLEWVEQPLQMMAVTTPAENPEKTWLRVRIGNGIYGVADLYGTHLAEKNFPSATVLMDRASIPPDVLQPHENYRNTPDISGRLFQVLICQKPEFKEGLWRLNPGNATKNAKAMLDEFVKLKAHPLPELGWNFSVRQFLNKWGLWSHDSGFSEDRASVPISMMPLLQKHQRPDFVLLMPHLLKEQQEKYSKALQPSHRYSWLRSHRLSLDPTDDFPPFVVRASYCSQAIEAAITIVHLAGLKFGICKRCGSPFEKETRHKKSYCSERCFNAAGVQRWREKQRKAAKKGVKRNAKG